MQMRKITAGFLALLAAMATVFVAPPAAQAFITSGCDQPSTTVRYKEIWTASYTTPGHAAAQSWNDGTNDLIHFSSVLTNYNGYIDDDDFGSPTYAGYTLIEGNPYINQCGGDGVTDNWIAYWNSYVTDALSGAYRRSIMAHELGHALGLGHAGSYPYSGACTTVPLMYANASIVYQSCGIYNPRTDDINGVDSIY